MQARKKKHQKLFLEIDIFIYQFESVLWNLGNNSFVNERLTNAKELEWAPLLLTSEEIPLLWVTHFENFSISSRVPRFEYGGLEVFVNQGKY